MTNHNYDFGLSRNNTWHFLQYMNGKGLDTITKEMIKIFEKFSLEAAVCRYFSK